MPRYLPDFAGIFCLVLFLISLSTISDGLLRDGDTFWHIKVGSVMLEEHSLVDSDIFSHTAFGAPWTAHEWLSEIIMAFIHNVAGLEGILCFFLFIVSLSFWLLFKLTEKNANQWVTFGCVALALAFSPSHMAARPHLFTWLFMLLTLTALNARGRHLYWLPVITMFWANLHGGFILGLALQSIFILGSGLDNYLADKTPYRDILRRQKAPALVLLLSICAVGLNPFGYELLIFPFVVSKGVFSQMIGEWKAPNLQDMWYFRFYLVALVLLITSARNSMTWTERLLIVFFLNAALTHIRHVSLMLIALTPFIARTIDNNLGNWWHKDMKNIEKKQLELSPATGPLITTAIALTLLVSGSIDQRSLSFLTPKSVFKVETVHLNQLVDFLDKNLPNGKMYNEYALGGYLLYALTPPPKVFIDGRADMYGEQIFSDYNTIKSSGSKREELLEQYEVDCVVFEKDSDLVAHLRESGQWQSTFTNEVYAVLKRTSTDKTAKKGIN
jgi:hypothetical protein